MEEPNNNSISRARIAKFGYLAFFISIGALALWQKRRFKTQLEKGSIRTVSLSEEEYGGKLFGRVFINHGVKLVFVQYFICQALNNNLLDVFSLWLGVTLHQYLLALKKWELKLLM